jgi:calcineurin-like phosphoesterase
LRILFIGGVVGAAGMTAVKSILPDAISRCEVDLAVVNGENSAGAGFVCEIFSAQSAPTAPRLASAAGDTRSFDNLLLLS